MGDFSASIVTRRTFLQLGTLAVTGVAVAPRVAWANVQSEKKVTPRGTARFCIFLMLNGGPSHVDAWDLKEGVWTPQDFDIRTVPGPVGKWPYALYPRLAERFDKIALVRSVEAWDSVHGRACYYVQAAHPLNIALMKEIPPIGSVVGLEYGARRKPSEGFPPYLAMNSDQSQAGLLNAGFLPAKLSPFHINTVGGVTTIAPDPSERERFARRWAFLQRFDARLRADAAPEAKPFRDYNDYYLGAIDLMNDPRTSKVFKVSPEDHKRYGDSPFGDACSIARNLVAADAGTHFIFISQNGWDHHSKIYDRKAHYKLSVELDAAVSALLDDLSNTKRGPNGPSLLDETLLVCMGEFGRTPGLLTANAGRDHYQYAFTALFAGGGVKGGQVMGKTDDLGAKITNTGWQHKRSIYMEDIATTVYSAMGIDWTKKITTTPSGRTFYYVEPFSGTTFVGNYEISALFA